MGRLFSDQHKYNAWLAVELAVCKAWADDKAMPLAAYNRIKKNANFKLERIEAMGDLDNINLGRPNEGETVNGAVVYAPAGNATVNLNTDPDDPSSATVDGTRRNMMRSSAPRTRSRTSSTRA